MVTKNRFNLLFVFSLLFLFGGWMNSVDAENLIIHQESWAIGAKKGLMYFVDADGYFNIFDLAGGKIVQKVGYNQGLLGYIHQIEASPESGMVFISQGLPGPSGRFYVLDDSVLAQGVIKESDAVITGRGKILSVFNPKNRKIYLTSSLSPKVLVIDFNGGKWQKSAEINLGNKRPIAMAISATADKIYVLSEGSGKRNDLDVINASANSLIKTLKIDGQPVDLLIDEKTGRIFISSRVVDKLFVFDRATDELLKEIPVPAGPGRIISGIDGSVYLTSNDAGALTILDSRLNQKTISLGEFAHYSAGPFHVYFNDVFKRLYVLNAFTGSIFAIDGRAGEIIKKIKVDGFPLMIAGWPDRGKIFVLRRNSPRLMVIDEKDFSLRPFFEGEAVKENKFFSSPQTIVSDLWRNQIYVTNLGNNTVTVIDGKNKKPVKVIPVGAAPIGITLSQKSDKLYTINRGDNTITAINLDTFNTKTITVNGTPNGIAINFQTNKVYVSQASVKSVAVIDGQTDEVLKFIPVGLAPHNITVDNARNKIYVSNFGEDTVSVIDGQTDQVVNTIKVGKTPTWSYLINNNLFVSVEGKKSLVVIDQETETVIAEIQLKAVPYKMVWDRETPPEWLFIHKRFPMVAVIDPLNYKILREQEMPFLTKTDRVYNQFFVDWHNKFIYLTQGSRNAIHVVKFEGKLSNGNFKLAAVITNDGTIWQPGFGPSPDFEPSTEKNGIAGNIVWILVGAALVGVPGAFWFWFKKKKFSGTV